MPVRLQFPLEGPPPLTPFQHATGLRALVLSWIKAVDPALSAAVHDDPGPKPYSISPLWETDSGPVFELSLLSEPLTQAVLAGMEATGIGPSGGDIRLGSQAYRVYPPRPAQTAGWESLGRVPTEREHLLELRLLTPTAHHATGPFRKSIVLPQPELYFGSWMGRWNKFAPHPLPETLLQLVLERVAVGACAGQTYAVQIDRQRTFNGFQGVVRFQVLRPQDVSREELSALWSLARLGSFSGTGVETMRGMGQTEVMDDGG